MESSLQRHCAHGRLLASRTANQNILHSSGIFWENLDRSCATRQLAQTAAVQLCRTRQCRHNRSAGDGRPRLQKRQLTSPQPPSPQVGPEQQRQRSNRITFSYPGLWLWHCTVEVYQFDGALLTQFLVPKVVQLDHQKPVVRQGFRGLGPRSFLLYACALWSPCRFPLGPVTTGPLGSGSHPSREQHH